MTWELTPDIEEEILSQLEDGVSLVTICKMDDMPSRRTVLRWQREIPEFGTKCAHAREAQGDLAADKLDDLNDKVEHGMLEPSAASIISSNLKWKASKLAPKKYGDSTTLKGDPEAPLVPSTITHIITDDLIKARLEKVRDDN
jgi:hypothetical protein